MGRLDLIRRVAEKRCKLASPALGKGAQRDVLNSSPSGVNYFTGSNTVSMSYTSQQVPDGMFVDRDMF